MFKKKDRPLIEITVTINKEITKLTPEDMRYIRARLREVFSKEGLEEFKDVFSSKS